MQARVRPAPDARLFPSPPGIHFDLLSVGVFKFYFQRTIVQHIQPMDEVWQLYCRCLRSGGYAVFKTVLIVTQNLHRHARELFRIP